MDRSDQCSDADTLSIVRPDRQLLNPVSESAPSFTYTPFYCEENVYLLCKQLSLSGNADPNSTDRFVAFISNDEKQVPLFLQKASKRVDGLVVWDYHVICIQSRKDEESRLQHLVWDLDSTLPSPISFREYMAETLQPRLSSSLTLKRYFRLVHAPMFLRHFGSDRSHMKDSFGNWLSPPPSYDPIIAQDGTTNNIKEYIEIQATDQVIDSSLVESLYSRKLGVIVGEDKILDLFSWLSGFEA
ncbi:amino-terminal glutamine amidohydrolase [Wolffia australiana]